MGENWRVVGMGIVPGYPDTRIIGVRVWMDANRFGIGGAPEANRIIVRS